MKVLLILSTEMSMRIAGEFYKQRGDEVVVAPSSVHGELYVQASAWDVVVIEVSMGESCIRAFKVRLQSGIIMYGFSTPEVLLFSKGGSTTEEEAMMRQLLEEGIASKVIRYSDIAPPER